MRKNKTPGKGGSNGNGSNSNSSAVQRQCVLDALRESPNGLTTIELREKFDVMMPAARVHELRWIFGYNIESYWDHDTNAQGNKHGVVRYVLLSGNWRGAA